MLHKFDVDIPQHEWEQTYMDIPLKSSTIKAPKRAALIDTEEQERLAAIANHLDIELYSWAVARFCRELCEAGLLQFDTTHICESSDATDTAVLHTNNPGKSVCAGMRLASGDS